MAFLVVGMMKNPQHAREVAKSLADAGFDREDISAEDGFIAGLCRNGVPEEERSSGSRRTARSTPTRRRSS